MKRRLLDRNRNQLGLEILEERHLLTVVVEQLMTPDSTSDSDPRVMGPNIVWHAKGGADAGTDNEIFWYDGTTINQVTEDTIHDRFPQISALGIAWEQGIGAAKKIGFDDNVNPQQFLGTPLPNFTEIFTLSDTRLTWEDAAEADFEILTWDNTGGVPVNLSNNTFLDRYADSQGDNLVWVERDDSFIRRVKHFNGTSTTTVGTSTFAINDPDVDGQKVAWDGFEHGGTNNHEIFYYNGTTAVQLTDDEKNDFAPQVQGDNVVWWNLVAGVSTIQYFDGSTVQTISTTSRNQWPQIDGDYVVWQGKGETIGTLDDDEIFLWDGSQVIQLTDNDVDDIFPQISGNHIVWQQQSGGSSEIFHATIIDDSTVAGRHIFYNQSGFDGGSAALGVADDAAIATNKSAYLPGAGVAVFSNITSYSRGINGIMIDLDGGGDHASITASDFIFKEGNDNTPGTTWVSPPATTAVAVRLGDGVGGSDRVTITWGTGAIRNKWLEVQVLATANTGLTSTDVHFWGNKVSDSGTSTPATIFRTTSSDALQVFATLTGSADVENLRDYNRSGGVTSTDALITFANIGTIRRIDIPGGGPFAPEAAAPASAGEDTDGEGGIAFALSGLATPTTSPGSDALSRATDRPPMPADSHHALIARYFAHLDAARGPRVMAKPGAALTDEVELPDEVLDALLVNLLAPGNGPE